MYLHSVWYALSYTACVSFSCDLQPFWNFPLQQNTDWIIASDDNLMMISCITFYMYSQYFQPY